MAAPPLELLETFWLAYTEGADWDRPVNKELHAHSPGPFTVGGLNCWENWMPLARAGHYARPDVTQLTVNFDRQTTLRST